MVNVRNEAVTFDVPAELENSAWKDTFDSSAITLLGSIDLEAYDYLVLTK